MSDSAPLSGGSIRTVWHSGDFGRIAQYGAAAAAALVGRLPIPAGARVLDVACGTGNFAIPTARMGAIVTGVDISGPLVEQARERAAREAVDVGFDEGNAEALPYPDGSFDVVMGLFGAMFAPRPDRVAAELIRVGRPGGTLLMANWTRRGFFGEMFRLSGRYLQPRGVPAILWGDEDVVRERLGPGVADLRMTLRSFPYEFPFGPAEVANLFRQHFGPTIAIVAALPPDRQIEYLREFERLWREHNQADADRTFIAVEYLEVAATRR